MSQEQNTESNSDPNAEKRLVLKRKSAARRSGDTPPPPPGGTHSPMPSGSSGGPPPPPPPPGGSGSSSSAASQPPPGPGAAASGSPAGMSPESLRSALRKRISGDAPSQSGSTSAPPPPPPASGAARPPTPVPNQEWESLGKLDEKPASPASGSASVQPPPPPPAPGGASASAAAAAAAKEALKLRRAPEEEIRKTPTLKPSDSSASGEKPPAPAPAPVSKTIDLEKAKASSASKIPIVIGGVVILLVLMAAGMFYFSSKFTDAAKNAQDEHTFIADPNESATTAEIAAGKADAAPQAESPEALALAAQKAEEDARMAALLASPEMVAFMEEVKALHAGKRTGNAPTEVTIDVDALQPSLATAQELVLSSNATSPEKSSVKKSNSDQQDPLVLEFLINIKVNSVSKKRVVLNDTVFQLGDQVCAEPELKVVDLNDAQKLIIFEDSSGVQYEKEY